ncbi:WYL domain-containing protein [Nocardia sp. NPDC049220]|uniref:WYL domain-containing protein n=1 Tax=Nocardia sp. NPDC049220 TaxID=3155273 RepID=UPI0033CAF745
MCTSAGIGTGRLGCGPRRLAYLPGRPDHAAIPTGPRFPPRDPPEGDVAAYLSMQLSARSWPHQATVSLHCSAEVAADNIWPGMGVVEAVDDHNCRPYVGGDSPEVLVWMITSVDIDFTLLAGPPELVDAIRAQADRCDRAVVDFPAP